VYRVSFVTGFPDQWIVTDTWTSVFLLPCRMKPTSAPLDFLPKNTFNTFSCTYSVSYNSQNRPQEGLLQQLYNPYICQLKYTQSNLLLRQYDIPRHSLWHSYVTSQLTHIPPHPRPHPHRPHPHRLPHFLPHHHALPDPDLRRLAAHSDQSAVPRRSRTEGRVLLLAFAGTKDLISI
jgi:hypothetical protein